MRHFDPMKVNPNTHFLESGSVVYIGHLEIARRSHKSMCSRNAAYRATDDRGHLLRRSYRGALNNRSNVFRQDHDINHKAMYSIEKGERAALKNGAVIWSERTAFISNQPYGRPDAFINTDRIDYGNNSPQLVSHSLLNEPYVVQDSLNEKSAAIFSEVTALPNPNDTLRAENTAEEYSLLMEETNQYLPTISDDMQQWDYSGLPPSAAENSFENEFSGDMVTVSADETITVEANIAETAAEAEADYDL